MDIDIYGQTYIFIDMCICTGQYADICFCRRGKLPFFPSRFLAGLITKLTKDRSKGEKQI